MPRGGSRPGSGRKQKPITDHLRAGTYRADRHGPRPANVLPMPEPSMCWEPSDEDLAQLGTVGAAFVSAMLNEYEFQRADGVLLLEAGHALDAVSTWRRSARDADDLATQQSASRLAMGWQRQVQGLLHALKASRS